MHVVGNYLRLTLAEFARYEPILALSPIRRLKGGVQIDLIHVVLWETQVDDEKVDVARAMELAAIVSVEDIAGITIAVLKHRTGETWDRRVQKPIVVKSVEEGMAALKGRRGYVIADEYEPVVPRRDLPQACDCLQRGVKAMHDHLLRLAQGGPLRGFGRHYDSQLPDRAIVFVEGEFCLRELAKVFLDAYQLQITVSDEVKLGLAKRAVKLRLLRERERYDSLSFLGPYDDTKGEDQIDTWDDIIKVEGVIDFDALVRVFWRVMKEGQGE